jgi:hypothetical protein
MNFNPLDNRSNGDIIHGVRNDDVTIVYMRGLKLYRGLYTRIFNFVLKIRKRKRWEGGIF